MTDLERVKGWLRRPYQVWGRNVIDAHLKEDVERDARLGDPVAQDAVEEYIADLEDELAELREAVREHIDGNGAPNRTHDRLRQLIEEKE